MRNYYLHNLAPRVEADTGPAPKACSRQVERCFNSLVLQRTLNK